MKKIYNSPELSMLCINAKDVVTVSTDEVGRANSFSFNDIINGGAGWLEV